MMASLRHRLAVAWTRDAPWLTLLVPFSWLFCALAVLRYTCYRRGWLRVHRLPVPVIVVGNLVAGGSGKTPVVIALVEALQARGFRPGVISRGYGRHGTAARLASRGSAVEDCGDEPLMIQQRTGCPCAVGASRVAAARLLLSAAPVDVIVADDGLQHYALARDMEIVMYDADSAFGNGRCVPAGPLREPLARLARADFVLSRAYVGHADVVCRAVVLVNLQSGERRPCSPESIGTRVHALAAIAHPARFRALLQEAGFEPQLHAFPDHHCFSAADLATIGEGPLIMTEKDAVKWTHTGRDDAWFVSVSATLPGALLTAVEGRLGP